MLFEKVKEEDEDLFNIVVSYVNYHINDYIIYKDETIESISCVGKRYYIENLVDNENRPFFNICRGFFQTEIQVRLRHEWCTIKMDWVMRRRIKHILKKLLVRKKNEEIEKERQDSQKVKDDKIRMAEKIMELGKGIVK